MSHQLTRVSLSKIIYTSLLPLIAWMSLIFVLSNRQRIPLTSNYLVSFAIFKTLHFIEYAFLYLLWARFLHFANVKNKYVWAFVATALYAASDEIHQTFIPTREGKPRDVFIDLAGALTAWHVLSHNKYFKKITFFV